MFIFYKEVLVMVHPFFHCHALVNKQQNVLHTCIIYNILLLWKKKYLIFVKFIENLSSFLSVQCGIFRPSSKWDPSAVVYFQNLVASEYIHFHKN